MRPRLGDRSLFPELEAQAYLDHAAVSPLSEPVRGALERAIHGMAACSPRTYRDFAAVRENLRAALARLIHVRAENIALVHNASQALGLIASSLRFREGQRLLLFEGEYPSNVSPWQRAAARCGLEPVFIPIEGFARRDGIDYSDLERELERGARLVSLSAVQFQSGLRMPVDEIARRCREAGAEVCIDAAQACGVVPFDASRVDYAVGAAHKGLMGIEGCGFLFVHPDRGAALEPLLTGAMSHRGAAELFGGERDRLDYGRPLHDDARVFEAGRLGSLSCIALDVSAALISDLGVENIHRHVNEYLDALEPALLERGFASRRQADPERRSSILSLRPPAELSAGRLAAALTERGVPCSSPDGLLRLAPHWPNGLHEVPVVLQAVDGALAALG